MKTLSDYLGLASLAQLWLLQVVVVVLVSVAANIASHFLLRRAEKLTQRTASFWDDALVQAAKRPVPIVIWVVGIAFAAGIVGKESGAAIFESIPRVRDVGVVFCLAWFLVDRKSVV